MPPLISFLSLSTHSYPNHNLYHNTHTILAYQRISKAVDVKFPSSLDTLLSEVNGGIWFEDKKCLSSDDIIDAIAQCEANKKIGWKSTFIPFACDDVPQVREPL